MASKVKYDGTSISPLKVQQQPAVCNTSAADFVTCVLAHIASSPVHYFAIYLYIYVCISFQLSACVPFKTFICSMFQILEIVSFSWFVYFFHLNPPFLSSTFHPENSVVSYAAKRVACCQFTFDDNWRPACNIDSVAPDIFQDNK